MSRIGWEYLTPADKANILRGVRDGVAYGGPYHVELHPADRCNLDCFFCSTASIRGTDELGVTRIEELLAELRVAGTRSVRLSGGGEPLFHRKTKDYLSSIADTGIPVENITTNAILLNQEVAELLFAARCGEVFVSLNTADPKSYASMMQTTERNFDRAVRNVRSLIAARDRHGASSTRVTLQFLIWRENYRDILRMYHLARDLGVDNILFNGLSFLTPAQMMNAEETAEMLKLYEQVIREDEFRIISSIDSYEQDVTSELNEIKTKIHDERRQRGFVARGLRFFRRRDFSLVEKLQHRRSMRDSARTNTLTSELASYCIIAWYSLVVRTNGDMAACCILQGRSLGNVFETSLHEVWHGTEYERLRAELAGTMREGDDWKYSGDRHKYLDAQCGGVTSRCPIRSFYYQPDIEFVRGFDDLIRYKLQQE